MILTAAADSPPMWSAPPADRVFDGCERQGVSVPSAARRDGERYDVVLWDVVRPVSVLVGTGLVTAALGWLAERLVRRMAAGRPDNPLWGLLRRCRAPFLLTVGSLVLLGGEQAAALPSGVRGPLRHLLALFVIAVTAWLVSRVAALLVNTSFNRYAAVRRDPARVRRVRTQAGMLRRVTTVLVVLVALACMLMTFPQVRAVGTSLLASAGLIGVVAGVAAQSTLANLFAGLQVAFGDMVRIGDVVVVEGEWGTVEEITLTYLVLATWDQRRIVMPVSYFAGRPFENWSRHDPRMTGTVLLHLDHATPVPELREEFRRLLKDSPLWDGVGSALQVTDTTPSGIVVRALMTARDSDDAFTLRCEVRERLIDYLRRHHPQSLPRIATAPAATPDLPHPRSAPRADGGRPDTGRTGTGRTGTARTGTARPTGEREPDRRQRGRLPAEAGRDGEPPRHTSAPAAPPGEGVTLAKDGPNGPDGPGGDPRG
ncbi:mechanosensitive ion channel family protein [Streptomyces sp. NPDC092296]|uniref:mechanosensitive ion channel family protein n=1 Tax=Streptomyces sp. NPDC092296 TaxID=3366012 RepID=UPI00382CBF9C